MKRGVCVLLAVGALASMLALYPRGAYADAGDAGDAGDAAPAAEAGSSDDGGSAESGAPAVPLACDGSLCDTTNGSTCTLLGRSVGATTNPTSVAGILGVLAAALVRRRRSERRS